MKTVKKQASAQNNTAEASPSDSELPQEQASVAYRPASTNPGAMPADVEQMILTQISYPRQARRKGWQGKATFHLNVREQKLAKLDLFHSSGYELLDRAAMRGIQAVGKLPLANGLYSLPVEFRLQ
ncbi:TonB family protein [Mariprofundus ferrinatatus]|uniref:TonB family protein n=1 Tax=Mariprofundus ferrinatatus TaxID=1921087 RepID=UPI0012FF1FA3|nr:TonB family protein [Mariprofundus ferrinatatus]